MDVAGLSGEQGVRSGAPRRSNTARDQRARRPSAGTVLREPVHVSQGTSLSAPAADRPAGDVDPVAAARETADQLQAAYFVLLLTQNRRLTEHRVDEYQKAIATAEANGDVDAACSFRRMTRSEEQDRQTLDDMIERLRRRFPKRTPGQRFRTFSADPACGPLGSVSEG